MRPSIWPAGLDYKNAHFGQYVEMLSGLPTNRMANSFSERTGYPTLFPSPGIRYRLSLEPVDGAQS